MKVLKAIDCFAASGNNRNLSGTFVFESSMVNYNEKLVRCPETSISNHQWTLG